ncbi:MAG: hypothetical protein JKP92_05990 [Alphaproteobacteria bacterium]|jgi:hypothetical protein|nr:hypothetical protein [Alphaproteobacteria bacterium]
MTTHHTPTVTDFITEDESMKVTELSRALRVTLANIIKRNPVMHAHARTDVQRLYSILLKLWEELESCATNAYFEENGAPDKEELEHAKAIIDAFFLEHLEPDYAEQIRLEKVSLGQFNDAISCLRKQAYQTERMYEKDPATRCSAERMGLAAALRRWGLIKEKGDQS